MAGPVAPYYAFVRPQMFGPGFSTPTPLGLSHELYDNSDPGAVHGKVTQINYGFAGNILAFTVQATVRNDSNLDMHCAFLTLEFALLQANDNDITDIVVSSYGPTELRPHAAAYHNPPSINPQPPSVPCGPFVVPAIPLGAIPGGGGTSVSILFQVDGGGLTPADPRTALLEQAASTGGDIFWARDSSRSISHYPDLLRGLDPLGPGPAGNSNVSVFFGLRPLISQPGIWVSNDQLAVPIELRSELHDDPNGVDLYGWVSGITYGDGDAIVGFSMTVIASNTSDRKYENAHFTAEFSWDRNPPTGNGIADILEGDGWAVLNSPLPVLYPYLHSDNTLSGPHTFRVPTARLGDILPCDTAGVLCLFKVDDGGIKPADPRYQLLRASNERCLDLLYNRRDSAQISDWPDRLNAIDLGGRPDQGSNAGVFFDPVIPPTNTPTHTATHTPPPTASPTNTPTRTPPPPTQTFTPTNTPTATLTWRCVCAVPVAVGDFDNDKIPDGLEFDPDLVANPTGSNKYLWDSDGDGLSDGYEDANQNGQHDPGETFTRRRDSDNDGVWDSVERVYLGTNPLDPSSPVIVVDTDNDGLPVPLDPLDTNPDVDGDGFTDGYEAVGCGLLAVGNAGITPPLGDVDCSFGPTNLDALIIQSIFVGVTPHGTFTGEVNGDVNRDGFMTNLDALIVNTWFINLSPYLPVPIF